MKVLVDSFADIISPENLWEAWTAYRRGKRDRPGVVRFERRLEENLVRIHEDLATGSYRHGAYQRFVVHDPKERVISTPSIRDHLVHRAVYRVLYPFFDSIFLPQSFSCRVGRGTHRAIRSCVAHIQRQSAGYRSACWVLHGDILRCFDSIDHAILLELLARRISCRRTLALLRTIVTSHSVSTLQQRPCGIPLGNLTSQLFVNVYLHELDFFVTQRLKTPHYVRYADDFFIVCGTPDDCERIAEAIRGFLADSLRLVFPRDRQRIRRLANGMNVLGRMIRVGYSTVEKSSFRRMRALFAQRCREYETSRRSMRSLEASWQSLRGMLRYGHNTMKERTLQSIIYEHER